MKFFLLISLLIMLSCDDDSGGGGFDPSEGSGSTDGTEVEENINFPIHWDSDADGLFDNLNLFSDNGSITCIVNNEAGYMVGEGDMLSAYINEEQRGIAIAHGPVPAELSDYTYQFLLFVYGDASNLPISFKYYKHAEDVIFDILDTKEYIVNMTEGVVTNPIILEIDE